jgi:hypothetical protein
VASAGQLSMPKLEPQVPNPYKPKITKHKQQITNKFQITISKSYIESNAGCLEFRILVIVICLVFVFCYLKFLLQKPDSAGGTPETLPFFQHVVRTILLSA